MHGIHRAVFQLFPDETRVNCVQVNDHNSRTQEWFVRSVRSWSLTPMSLLYAEYSGWDFVLVVPWDHVRRFWSSNSGMQAWRHRKSGYTIPDHCRQTGGCPEVWSASDVKGKRELKIANPEEIAPYLEWHFPPQSRAAHVVTSFKSSTP